MAEPREKRNHPAMGPILRALLAVVLVGFVLSSGMVGYVLGQRAVRPTGELVDTIVLSPGEDASLVRTTTLHFLTGRVLRRDSTPCAGVTVRLKDEEKSDVTDEQGKFYLADMRSGSHTLEVLDEEGSLLSDVELQLDFSAAEDVSAQVAEAPASFLVPEDTRMLEVTLTVEEDDSLAVEENAYFVTRDGQIVTFNGTALTVEKDTHVVTPQGTVVGSQGYVLLPSRGVVFTPQGEEVEAVPGEEAIPGAALEEDGGVLVEEGVSLLATGEVLLPDGETVIGGEDKVVLVTEEEVQELEELPEVYVPARVRLKAPVGVPLSPVVTPEPEAESLETAEETGESSVQEAGEPEGTQKAASIETDALPEEEEEMVTAQAEQGLRAYSVDDTKPMTSDRKVAQWRQRSTIDLFKNRTDDLDLPLDENGIPMAAPGSKGYYEFRLENPEEYDIAYTIALQERSFHLPIRFSVSNAATGYSYLYDERLTDEGSLVSPEIIIAAGTAMDLRIDWDWYFEDWLDPETDDLLDTAATQGDRTYLLAVNLNAVQLDSITVPSADGSIRRPGVR